MKIIKLTFVIVTALLIVNKSVAETNTSKVLATQILQKMYVEMSIEALNIYIECQQIENNCQPVSVDEFLRYKPIDKINSTVIDAEKINLDNKSIFELRKNYDDINFNPLISEAAKRSALVDHIDGLGFSFDAYSVLNNTYTIFTRLDDFYDENGDIDLSEIGSAAYLAGETIVTATQMVIEAYPEATKEFTKKALGRFITSRALNVFSFVSTLAQFELEIYAVFRDAEIVDIFNYTFLERNGSLHSKITLSEQIFLKEKEAYEQGREFSDLDIIQIFSNSPVVSCYSERRGCYRAGERADQIYLSHIQNSTYIYNKFGKITGEDLTSEERIKVAIRTLADLQANEAQDAVWYLEEVFENNSSAADWMAGHWPYNDSAAYYRRIDPCYEINQCSLRDVSEYFEKMLYAVYFEKIINAKMDLMVEIGDKLENDYNPAPNPDTHLLSVSTRGSGTITASAGNIQCGETCEGIYDDGDSVTLSANSTSDSYFKHWTGGCQESSNTCNLTLNDSVVVGAHFSHCIELDYSWIKTGTIYAGETNNFDAQYKLVNRCSTPQSLNNSEISFHHIDGSYAQPCFSSGPITIPAYGTYLSGKQYCTVNQPGDYKVIQKKQLLSNQWVDNNIQYTSILPANMPATPSKPDASDGAYTDKVRITWEAINGIDAYKLYKCTNSLKVSCNTLTTTTSTAYDDFSGEDRINYFYRIRAYDSIGGDSEYSNADIGYKLGSTELPVVTGAPSATDGDYADKVIISWAAENDVVGYGVYRCSTQYESSCQFIGSTVATSFEDNEGLAGTIYYYRYRTVNYNGASLNYSTPDAGNRSGIASAPNKPSTPVASDGEFEEKVNISWNTSSEVSSYLVFRCQSVNESSCTHIHSTVSNAYNDTSGNVGTTYFYRIKAQNNNGTSIFSDADAGYRNNTSGAPGTPGKPDASDGDFADKVRISWTAVGGVDFYTVFRCSNIISGCIAIGTTSSTAFDDADVLPGTVYYYRIASENANDMSDYDAGYISENTPIPAPGTPSATDGEYLDKIVISWQPLAQADVLYRVYRCTTTSTNDCQRVCSVEGTSCNDRDSDGVRRNKTYYYRMKTLTPSLEESAYSDFDEGSLGNVASTPEKPTASYGLYEDRINVTWAAVEGAVQYDLYVCDSPTQSPVGQDDCQYIANTTNTYFDDTNQYTEDGRHLFYFLRADNGLGWSNFTGCCGSNVGFRITHLPEAPNVSARDGSNKDYIGVTVTLSDGAKQYEVYRCWNEDIDSCQLITTTDQYGKFEDYTAGFGVYYYRAKAIGSGHGNNGISDFGPYDKGSRDKGGLRQITSPTIDTRFDSMDLMPNDYGLFFGQTVSNNGDYALIGMRSYEKDIGGINQPYVGSAYIFKKETNKEWILDAELFASDESANNNFGQEVILEENAAFIRSGTGKIYVFEKQGDDSWIETQIISSVSGDSASRFLRMNLLGNRLILGAFNEVNNGIATGAVYIYEKNSLNQWVQVQKLTPQDLEEGDKFGTSLGQSENSIAIGSYQDDDNGEDAGAVYIYEKQSDSTWQVSDKLVSQTPEQRFYHFGIRLEMKGDVLAITSRYYHDGNNLSLPSYLSMYEKTANGDWLFTGEIHAADEEDGNLFGYGSYSSNIAINSFGNEMYIGAPGVKDSGGVNNDGAVYRFNKQANGQWEQTEKFKVNDNGEFEKSDFGHGLSISGNKLIIGAPTQFRGNSYYFGAAYTYFIPKEAGINFINKNGLFTSESGGTQELKVVLNSEPQRDVTIDFASTDTNEGTISPSSLTFTKENWYKEQSIIVTGVNDHVADGNTVYQIKSYDSISFDDLYNGLQTEVVNITNIEDGNTLELSIIGQGNVSSTPSGVDCDSSCSVIIANNPTLVLTATPGQGFEIGGWSGANCSGTSTCSVDMSQTQNVIVQFVPIAHDLNVQVSGSGVVKSILQGIDCGADCNESYLEGGQVTLFAQPENGHELSSWGVASCNVDAPCTITMDQERNLNVSFIPKTHEVSVISNEASGISPAINQYVINGETASFTINDIEGFSLDNITGSCGGTLNEAGSTYTTFPVNSDCSVQAEFVSEAIDVSISKTNNLSYLNNGQIVSYLITVSNISDANISNAIVQDILPSTLSNSTWECTAYLGANCTENGTGNIIENVSLPAGSYVEYLLTATVNAGVDDLVINTATVFVNGELAENQNNNTSTDYDQVVSIIFANGFDGNVVLKMINEEYQLQISDSIASNLYEIPGQYSLESNSDFEAGIQLRNIKNELEYRYYYVAKDSEGKLIRVELSQWYVVEPQLIN